MQLVSVYNTQQEQRIGKQKPGAGKAKTKCEFASETPTHNSSMRQRTTILSFEISVEEIWFSAHITRSLNRGLGPCKTRCWHNSPRSSLAATSVLEQNLFTVIVVPMRHPSYAPATCDGPYGSCMNLRCCFICHGDERSHS